MWIKCKMVANWTSVKRPVRYIGLNHNRFIPCHKELSVFWFIVLNATLNNISVLCISGGNRSTRKKTSTCGKSPINCITYYCIEYTSPWPWFELTTLVVICTACINSCKSIYHTITPTKAQQSYLWYLLTLHRYCAILNIHNWKYICLTAWLIRLVYILSSCMAHHRSCKKNKAPYATETAYPFQSTWVLPWFLVFSSIVTFCVCSVL